VEEVSAILANSIKALKSCHDARNEEIGIVTTVWLAIDGDWEEVCSELKDAAKPYAFIPTNNPQNSRAWEVRNSALVAEREFTCVDKRKKSKLSRRKNARGNFNKCLCDCGGYLRGNEILFIMKHLQCNTALHANSMTLFI